jgi:hypothetical protein
VFAFNEHDVAGVRRRRHRAKVKTCLFFNFAASTVLDALAKLKVTPGRRPRSCAVRPGSFTEQDKPLSEDEDSDTDSWLRRMRIRAHVTYRCH